jgi:hypothetical protein
MGRVENVLLVLVTAGLLGHTLMLGCDVGGADTRAATIATVLAGEDAGDPDCGCVEDYEAVAVVETESESEGSGDCPYLALKRAHEETGVEVEAPASGADAACPFMEEQGAEPARGSQPTQPPVDPHHTAERAGGVSTRLL